MNIGRQMSAEDVARYSMGISRTLMDSVRPHPAFGQIGVHGGGNLSTGKLANGPVSKHLTVVGAHRASHPANAAVRLMAPIVDEAFDFRQATDDEIAAGGYTFDSYSAKVCLSADPDNAAHNVRRLLECVVRTAKAIYASTRDGDDPYGTADGVWVRETPRLRFYEVDLVEDFGVLKPGEPKSFWPKNELYAEVSFKVAVIKAKALPLDVVVDFNGEPLRELNGDIVRASTHPDALDRLKAADKGVIVPKDRKRQHYDIADLGNAVEKVEGGKIHYDLDCAAHPED